MSKGEAERSSRVCDECGHPHVGTFAWLRCPGPVGKTVVTEVQPTGITGMNRSAGAYTYRVTFFKEDEAEEE